MSNISTTFLQQHSFSEIWVVTPLLFSPNLLPFWMFFWMMVVEWGHERADMKDPWFQVLLLAVGVIMEHQPRIWGEDQTGYEAKIKTCYKKSRRQHWPQIINTGDLYCLWGGFFLLGLYLIRWGLLLPGKISIHCEQILPWLPFKMLLKDQILYKVIPDQLFLAPDTNHTETFFIHLDSLIFLPFSHYSAFL